MRIDGYKQQHQMKVIRTLHTVEFGIDCPCHRLLNMIQQVPPDAKLVGFEESGDDNWIVLEFREESELL